MNPLTFALLLALLTVLAPSNSHPLVTAAYHRNGNLNPSNGLGPICGDCVRYVRGFDVTGVTNEVDLTVKDNIHTVCDCINACKKRKGTCANFVWKFTDASGQRTCTLYSNFNLPPSVTLAYNITDSKNIGLLSKDNNPQGGQPVPSCTLNG
ncbi:hypothetical protein HDV00_012744 [Rhizophlyctis rosea]|nr:hypothetical protein HDV00_012744 [Rhizophlyctis rosea]